MKVYVTYKTWYTEASTFYNFKCSNPTEEELTALVNYIRKETGGGDVIITGIIPLYTEENDCNIDAKTSGNLLHRLNINDFVKVKLTDYGKTLYYQQNDAINEKFGRVVIKPAYPEIDADGFTTIQLWHLMSIYGPHMRNGAEVPFEMCSIYIPDNILTDA